MNLKSSFVTWTVVLFTAISVFAKTQVSKTQDSSFILSRDHVDSTGEVFETTQEKKKFPKQPNGSIVIAFDGDKVLRPSEKQNHLAQKKGSLDSAAPPSEAMGVIVEFQEKPILKARAEGIQKKRSFKELETLVAGKRKQIFNEHSRARQQIQARLGKALIARQPKALKGKIRVQEFKDAFNGIALLDISVKEARKKLAGLPDIKKIYPNVTLKAELQASVPMIKANQVWQRTSLSGVTLDGAGMRIGIIDSGVDYRHPDLGGCFGPNCKVVGGYDFYNKDADPMDDHGHGTHVAAIAAGNGFIQNADGTMTANTGVAPGAKIYAYKILSATGNGTTDLGISAIQACADPNMDGSYSDRLDVCNISLGGRGNPDDPISKAVDNVTANGVVFIVAAGNEGPTANSISSPGTARSAITVAAACKSADIGVDMVNCATPIARFSSVGPVTWTDTNGVAQALAKPDIAAPGVRICSAQFGTYYSSSPCGPGHIAIHGTSMAAPQVAGVVALLRQAHPELTPDQVKSFLKLGAVNLGVSADFQGAGLLDSFAAVSKAGLPAATLKFDNAPLVAYDSATTQISHFTKVLSVTNISAGSLTYTVSFGNASAGLSASFDRASVTLAAGASTNLSVTLHVDHSLAMSSAPLNGQVVLTAGASVAKASAYVYVANKLSTDTQSIDLGVNFAASASYAGHQAVLLKNKMTDASATYTASVVCCSAAASGGTNSAIIASVSPSSVTITPGGVASLSLDITANNSAIPNGRYFGYLLLNSSTQSLKIPITFYKGYGVRVTFTGEVPLSTQVQSSEAVVSAVYAPVPQMQIYYLDVPGPFNLVSQWSSTAVGELPTTVIKQVQTTTGMVDVSVSKADAVHTIQFSNVGPNGVASNETMGFAFHIGHRGFLNGMNWTGQLIGQNGLIARVSNIPSTYTLTAMLLGKSAGYGITHSYQLNQGINSSMLLTNAVSDLVKKNVVGFQNTSIGQPHSVWAGICHEKLSSSSCIFPSIGNFSAPTNQPVGFYFYGVGPTPDLTTEWMAPSVRFMSQAGGVYGAKTSGYHVRSTGTYVMPSLSSIRGAPATGLAQAFRNTRVAEAPGNIIPVGAGPLFEDARWFNYADQEAIFSSSLRSSGPLHYWGGLSDETGSYTKEADTYFQFARDGAVEQTGYVYAGSGSNDKVTLIAKRVGSYVFEASRKATIAGVLTQIKSVSTFKVVSLATHQATPVDENPPAIRELHLLSNGVWQNVIDPAVVNSLKFRIDPVPGRLTTTTAMADSISQVLLEASTNGSTWIPVSLTNLGNSEYSGNIPITSGISLYSFRISLKDMAANSYTYSFQLPTGAAFVNAATPAPAPEPAPPPPAPTSVCTKANPVITPSSQTKSGLAGSVISYSVSVKNQDSSTCAASSFNISKSLPVGWSATVSPSSLSLSPGASASVTLSVTSTSTASGNNNITVSAISASSSAYSGSATAIYSVTVPAPVCTKANPIITPSSQIKSGLAGSVISYSVSVKNQDSSACAASSFNISRSLPSGWSATVSPSAVSLSPGASANVTLTATSPSTASGNNNIIVNAISASSSAYYSSATAIYSVTPPPAPATDTTAPTIAITSPANQALVLAKSTVAINASATDNVQVNRVEIYVNGVLICTDTAAPYSCSWKVPTVRKRSYTIQARAIDSSGNAASSALMTVTSK